MKALPEIVCQHCNRVQPWRNQNHCIMNNCGRRLNLWSVLAQLRIKRHVTIDDRIEMMKAINERKGK